MPGLAVTAALAALVVAVVAIRADHTGPTQGGSGIGQTYRVGVEPGGSVPDYLAASERELSDLLDSSAPSAPAYALVSFVGYQTPQQVAPLLDGADPARLYARLPLPDVQTEIIHFPAYQLPADAVAGFADAARRKDRQAVGYRELSREASGAQRDRHVLSASIAEAEAAAYRQACRCLYAAVVRADPATLDAIRERPQVRSVDPAPEVRQLDRAVFLPPLPEQTGRATPPADIAPGAVTPTAVTRPQG